MAVTSLSAADFQSNVLSAKGVVFVDFYAEWCGPCKLTEPIIHEMAEVQKNVTFYKINVDENADLASQYSVFSIPTFIIFKDGEIVSQFSGAQSRESFMGELQKAIA